MADVDEMVTRGHRPSQTELARLFEAIVDQLYRFPAVDPGASPAAVLALETRHRPAG